ncbi:MAG: DUF2807 domain-containing protein [Hyphomonas sp.]|nr:DUF2807 domain-containing protein [Hyphomonas sp.]
MKKSVILASGIAALALYASPSTASADTTRVYNLSGFDELDIAAGIEVKFTRAPEHSITADFERGGPEDVKVRLDGERLYLSRKSTRGWGKKVRVKFTVTAPELNEIEASSGSSLLAEGLESGPMEIDVSSGAAVSVHGECTSLEIKASSGGRANAKGLACQSVEAKASSGGSITAYASESATSKTSSGGNVDIYGNPASRSANKSISGGATSFHGG